MTVTNKPHLRFIPTLNRTSPMPTPGNDVLYKSGKLLVDVSHNLYIEYLVYFKLQDMVWVSDVFVYDDIKCIETHTFGTFLTSEEALECCHTDYMELPYINV